MIKKTIKSAKISHKVIVKNKTSLYFYGSLCTYYYATATEGVEV